MAGTIILSLRAIHTFQRRFDVKSLTEALKESHLYIVSRRPRTRIVLESVTLNRGELSFSVEIASETESSIKPQILDFSRSTTIEQFSTHIDGSYFSFQADSSIIHGDAWALASLASGLDPGISQQEIVYIGQAFGPNGKRSTQSRLRNHEKLQAIYSDHAGEPWDIFVTPISLDKSAIIGDDHIDDAEDGPDLSIYHETLIDRSGKPLKAAIDLAEHALISHFKPSYNIKLRQWRPQEPTVAMGKMTTAGFRLLAVELSCAELLVRFYSREQARLHRGYMILHDIPTHQKRSTDPLRPISAENISDWRFGSILLRRGHDLVSQRAEFSAAVLAAFGSDAPAVRRPPGVELGSSSPHSPDADRTLARMATSPGGWTTPIDDAVPITKSERAQLNRPFPLWDHPTYNNDGCIAVRHSDLAHSHPWSLHSHDGLRGSHGLIIGPQIESTAMLRQLALEAARSQVLKVVIAVNGDRPPQDMLNSWRGAIMVTNDAPSTVETLWPILHYQVMAGSARSNSRVSRSNPGVLVVIPELADILTNASAAGLLSDLLDLGSHTPLSVIVATERPELLETVSTLNARLARAENFAALSYSQDEGEEFLCGLRYMQEEPRKPAFTGRGFEFAFWFDERGAGVGQLVAYNADIESLNEAISWVHYLLSMAAEHDAERLIARPGRDGAIWSVIDAVSAQSWCILRMHDGWALIHQYAHYGARFGGDAAGKVARWASAQLSTTIVSADFAWAESQSGSGLEVGSCQLTEPLTWNGRAGRSLFRLVGDRIGLVASPSDMKDGLTNPPELHETLNRGPR